MSVEAKPVSAPATAWDGMSAEQRSEYMRETVLPAMKTLFVQFDAERFADFGCQTCHGDNAREVSFKMPNGLVPLVDKEIAAVFESDQPMAKFMTTTVWPKMGELLGEPLFDAERGEGFACLNCHAELVK